MKLPLLKNVSTLVIIILILTNCTSSPESPSVFVGAEAGPLNVTISMDTSGQISVSGGFSPKIRVGLGPISLQMGIEQTIEFTRKNPYYLFIIWQDESGQIQREEYEIGKKFRVQFSQHELIKEIQGENDSIIVVIERKNLPSSLTDNPSNSIVSQQPIANPNPIQAPNPAPRPVLQNCNIAVDSNFRDVWQKAGGIEAGCPINNSYQKRVGYQSFQNGFMFWRGGLNGDANGIIYVGYNSGKWQEYQDSWVDGMNERAGYSPPTGLYEPRRGFGSIWQKLGGPNAEIGWALTDEIGSDYGKLQDFTNNAIIFLFPDQSPIFMPDGKRWVR